MSNQKINCNVKHCIHNDTTSCTCKLESIKVANCSDKATHKEDTICDDFDCKCGCK